MRLDWIQLKHFRNIKDQKINLHPGLNIFRGQNGQGKTNLIESVYALTMGHSFRSHRPDELVDKSGPGAFRVQGRVSKGDISHDLEFSFSKGKKVMQLNSKNISSPKLKTHFSSVLFSPESLSLVKDAPQKRRDLIDDLCLSLFPDFFVLYRDFKRLLSQKNSLLKKIRDSELEKSEGEKLLETYTEQFFTKGARLVQYRLQAIKEIQPLLLEEFLKIMDEHYGTIEVQYSISGNEIGTVSYEQILNAMYKRWLELKAREIATGVALVGPHKHEIDFKFNGHQARFYCSQGQQRAIVLAFKMAQTRLHFEAHKEYPILLLDDVLSELDYDKQTRFLNYLFSTKPQVFLTTTDVTQVSDDQEKSVFEVKEGFFIEGKSLFQEA